MTHISANSRQSLTLFRPQRVSTNPLPEEQDATVMADRFTPTSQSKLKRSAVRKITTEAAYWSRKVALKVAEVAAGLFGVGLGVSPANLTGADKLHSLGIDGSGVRIAVLDQGFTKFGAGDEDVLGVYDTRTGDFTKGLEKSKSDAVGEIVTGQKGLSFHGNAMNCIITGESMGNQLLCCYGEEPQLNEWVLVSVDPPVDPVTDVPVTFFGDFEASPDMEEEQVISLYRMNATGMETME